MSDVVCKHGWSRRFCEQCSQAHIIASLKGPGDKGMLATPPDDLVEKVALEIHDGLGGGGWGYSCYGGNEEYHMIDELKSAARAAIALVLEEAAKVCDPKGDCSEMDTYGATYAAAIRAMVKHD